MKLNRWQHDEFPPRLSYRVYWWGQRTREVWFLRLPRWLGILLAVVLT